MSFRIVRATWLERIGRDVDRRLPEASLRRLRILSTVACRWSPDSPDRGSENLMMARRDGPRLPALGRHASRTPSAALPIPLAELVTSQLSRQTDPPFPNLRGRSPPHKHGSGCRRHAPPKARCPAPPWPCGMAPPPTRSRLGSRATPATAAIAPGRRTLLAIAAIRLPFVQHPHRCITVGAAHFFASFAIKQFCPGPVQDVVGHSSIKMPFDTYGDLFPSKRSGEVRRGRRGAIASPGWRPFALQARQSVDIAQARRFPG